ncbi:MAG: hypothetical protein HY858_10045 [Candidatus Solibacter usitatus]|nr:hypothetical protein [Candidatus Solibacter usitatus]
MRLMLLTLRKDVRRLWPAVAVTWLMLAALANADRWRADWMPSPMEGWTNLLLCGAWACLAALAVLEEPLVGDRHFWLTRPHRWPALLTAKLLFVALAIHLPSFFADIFVLAARGLPPASHLGDLLSKQVLFFGWMVLPAMAVAALVRNFAQFVIALFAIGTGLAMLNGGFQSIPDYSGLTSQVRHTLVRALLAGAAIVVIYTQYARRSVLAARLTGIAAALAASAVFAFLPALAEYAVRGVGLAEAPRIALRNTASGESVPSAVRRQARPTVLLPIAVAPGEEGARVHVPLVDVEIVAPDGSRVESARPTPNRPFQQIDLMAVVYSASRDNPLEWLVLSFTDSAWNRVKNAHVRIGGSAALEFYHPGETTILPMLGSGNVPGLGRCTAATVEDRFSEQMLKVLCESPRVLPAASITLRHEPSGRVWMHGLNSAVTYAPGPHGTWLSPLHRGQSFFRLTGSVPSEAGSQWLVPASYLSSSRVEITPRIVTGRALARFDFAGVALSSWLVPR